jgi:hypothetical protein
MFFMQRGLGVNSDVALSFFPHGKQAWPGSSTAKSGNRREVHPPDFAPLNPGYSLTVELTHLP